jgi:hypothetical protein
MKFNLIWKYCKTDAHTRPFTSPKVWYWNQVTRGEAVGEKRHLGIILWYHAAGK